MKPDHAPVVADAAPAVDVGPAPARESSVTSALSPVASPAVSPAVDAGGPGRGRLAAAAAGVVGLVGTLVGALEFSHGAYTRLPADLAGADPGPVTGWGLPVSRVACDAAGVATVGALLAAAFLFPAAGGRPGAAGQRMLRGASVAAWLWCLASVAQFAFTVSNLIGRPLPGALTGHNISDVLNAVPQPRALLIVAAVTFAVAVGAGTARRLDTSAWLLAVAVLALLPVAMTGHAHGNGGHDLATISGGMHVVAVCVWVGGLAALLLGARRLRGPELVTAVARYSSAAGLCLFLVTLSGVVNAYVRVVAFDALFDSRYGNLVLIKTGALVVLAGCGAAHRRHTIRRLTAAVGDSGDGGPAAEGLAAARRPFVWLGVAELVVMAVAVALGAALSLSPTPAQAENASSDNPVLAILGFPMPPAISISRIITQDRPDLLFLPLTVIGAWYYLKWVLRLRRAGASWPIGRTVAWLAGLAVLAFVTNSGLAEYGRVLFSVHMVQHLLLMMLSPILLNLGAPVTLALRALPTGVTGTTRSARAWLLRVVNSRWMTFVSNPIVAWGLFAVSLFVLYLTPLFGWVMRNHLAHLAMELHFLLVGYLFFWLLIGVDPGPRRPSHPMRIILLFTASAVHTFFGIIIMMSGSVLGSSYYSLLHRAWGASALTDQHLGGGMAWSFGELPGVAVILVLVYQWARGDERRARAKDARMDSGEDDEFVRYNAYLAGLAGRKDRPGG